MKKSSNPFEHHHHHHDDGGDGAEPIDPAQESLADALRVSFFILKVVMLILLGWYLLSGIYNVHEQEVAVKLRFGHFVGDSPQRQVKRPGGPYITFPYPIDDVIRVDTTVKTLTLDKTFWFEISEKEEALTADELAAGKQGPLNPQRDSYLLTGDANILHLRWKVTYKVGGDAADTSFAQNVIDYVENVGDPDSAQVLVSAAAERSIVAYVAKSQAKDLIDGLSVKEASEVRAMIQRALDDLAAGVQVTSGSVTLVGYPNPVRNAFAAVTSAENERSRAVESARKERENILSEAAGQAHDAIWPLIREYQAIYEHRETKAIEPLERELSQIFENLNTGDKYGNLQVGGESARIINESKTYRTQILKEVESEVETFEGLREQFQQTPDIVVTRLWEDARDEIMDGRVQKFIARDGKIVITLGRDPKLLKTWEQEDLEKQDEAAKEGLSP